MKMPRAHVLVFIGLLFVFCIGCARDENGGCYCPRIIHVVPHDSPPLNQSSTSQVQQPDNGNLWQNSDNLGPNKMGSGVSGRDMTERPSSSSDRDSK